MHDFSPDELDRLEDALADLGREGAIGEVPERLRARLGEYEQILALTREAMPLEEPREDLLAAVLAEARVQAAPAATPQARRRGPGLWERLRRSLLLPGVALAGTAALLLWWVQPGDEEAPRPMAAAPAPAAPEARSPAPPQAVSPDMPKEEKAIERAADDSPADEAAVAPAAGGGAPAADRRDAAVTKAKKAEAPPPAPLPGLDVQEQARVDIDKETLRDQLERGDAARERGRCAAAEDEYLAVARSKGPAAERARALLGLSMCSADAGRATDAARYLAEARRLDPSVGRIMEREERRPAKMKSADHAEALDSL